MATCIVVFIGTVGQSAPPTSTLYIFSTENKERFAKRKVKIGEFGIVLHWFDYKVNWFPFHFLLIQWFPFSFSNYGFCCSFSFLGSFLDYLSQKKKQKGLGICDFIWSSFFFQENCFGGVLKLNVSITKLTVGIVVFFNCM